MSLCQGYVVNWPSVATLSSFHSCFKMVLFHNKHDLCHPVHPFVCVCVCVCVCVWQQPHSGLGRFVFEVSISHTIRHTDIPGRTPLNERSAGRRGRYIHNAQRTTNTRHEHPCRQGNSNPQFHQSGHRPTPHTVRPPVSANLIT